MRIEITDRAAYLAHIDASIESIRETRRKEDALYEAAWAAKYHARGKWRWLFGPHSEKPPERHIIGGFYPSIYAWGDLEKLKRLKAGSVHRRDGCGFRER